MPPVISIVMPAHNEEEYLEAAVEEVISGLSQRGDGFEIIVVENGSLDGTAAHARSLASQHPVVSVLSLEEADYGAALKRGFQAARGDVVVNFDVDLVDLDFLDRALGELAAAPDVTILVGSKRAEGALDERGPGRRIVTATFAAVLRYGFGLGVSDTHGLKALRREPLVRLVEQCRFGKDIFDTELILRAEQSGLRVREIPVNVSDTRPPRTPIGRRIPRTLWGLSQLRVALLKKPLPTGASPGTTKARRPA